MKKFLLLTRELWIINGMRETKNDDQLISDRSEVKKYIDDWVKGWKENGKQPGWLLRSVKITKTSAKVRMQITDEGKTRIDTYTLKAKVQKATSEDLYNPTALMTCKIPRNHISERTEELLLDAADFVENENKAGERIIYWGTIEGMLLGEYKSEKLKLVPAGHRKKVREELQMLLDQTRGYAMIWI